MLRRNVHATALVIGPTGLLILGDSGSGKSLLAATLLDNARSRRSFAALLADDRVWLSILYGRLVAEAPEEISGLLELRGYGPARICYERTSIIDRVVRLVDHGAAPRMRNSASEEIAGVSLPCLVLSARSTRASVAAVQEWLDAPDFEPA